MYYLFYVTDAANEPKKIEGTGAEPQREDIQGHCGLLPTGNILRNCFNHITVR